MKKIAILELDITVIKEGFVTYSAGIWQRTMSVSETAQAASFMVDVFGATWDSVGSDLVEIGAVRVGNAILGSLDSLAELRDQDGSFYYDSALQILYIAISDYAPAWSYNTYKTGETTGFISEAQLQLINGVQFPTRALLGSVYYEPRLQIDDLSITESVDDQTNGIFVYDELEATINNADGEYDTIRDEVTGNEARVLIANLSESLEEEQETGFPYKSRADRSDFEPIREGIIDDIDYSDPSFPAINAIDPRSDWTQTIGTTLMTTDDYPNLDSSYENSRKPVIIGTVKGTECIPLQEDPDTATDSEFLICDTSLGNIQAVDNIYFEGTINSVDVDRYLTSSEYEVDLTTGVLTVYDFEDGDAYFYGTVTELSETVEILLFLLEEYQGLSYITSNFNMTEMDAIAALSYTTHVYIDEDGEELSDIIEKLVTDIQCDFYQQGSVFTLRKGNEERASREEIYTYEISDNPAGWVNDRTDTVKTISVGYNRDYRLETYDKYYDDSQEQTAYDNNRKAVDYETETNLISALDVAEIYDEYYNRFIAPSRVVTINRLLPFTAGLTDFVTFTVERNTTDGVKGIFERGIYKIIELDQRSNTAEIVYFSDSPEPYTMIGLAAGRTPAFAAPTAQVISYPYSGKPAFGAPKVESVAGMASGSVAFRHAAFRYHAGAVPTPSSAYVLYGGNAAFRRPASPGGAYIVSNPVAGSGYRAGYTRQIGD